MINVELFKFELDNDKRLSEIAAKRKLYLKYGILDRELTFNEYGKPYIINNKFYFNISHSYGFIGIAKSEKEIGIDLEYIRPIKNINKLIKKITNNSDLEIKSDIEFLKIYTIKEAYLKYLGIGLVNDLNNIFIDYKNMTIRYKEFKIGYFKTYIKDDLIVTIVDEENDKVIIGDCYEVL